MYNLFYWLMIIGYIGVSFLSDDLKPKIIGILLGIVNGIIFWKG